MKRYAKILSPFAEPVLFDYDKPKFDFSPSLTDQSFIVPSSELNKGSPNGHFAYDSDSMDISDVPFELARARRPDISNLEVRHIVEQLQEDDRKACAQDKERFDSVMAQKAMEKTLQDQRNAKIDSMLSPETNTP